MILGAVAAAAVGCAAAYAIRNLHDAPPPPRAGAAPAQAAEDPEKLFGSLIVEPGWRSEGDGQSAASATTVASLGPEPPAAPPVLTAPAAPASPVPPATAETPPTRAPVTETPSVVSALPDIVPFPPIRDVPRIDESVPLPPVRPADLAEPAPIAVAPNPVAPERRVVAAPAPGPAAPGDGRNVFEKLLGIGQQPGAVVASRPPVPAPAAVAPSRPAAAPVAATPPAAAPIATTVARATPGDARGGIAGLFSAFSSAPRVDHLGYDRQTAIYDISARVVYMPDGTRLEAHSGLGAALDNVRYVSERAIGPTPPHLYELKMRESLFHGVQAIRLNPVGDGALYGRDGFLAHPYMLGENGDSNGCVSFKDYDAFLRAYQNGQINKLAVVSRL